MQCEPSEFFGQELVLNCKSGNENVLDMNKITEFVDDLVVKIDMIKHGDIKIERFGEGDLVGVSCCQFIKTSSIVGHFCDISKDFYLNIFSCKRFSEDVVVDCVRKWFEPTQIKRINLMRGI